MSPIALWVWIVIGVAAWIAVAAVTAVLIGGVIRRRDRQAPAPDAVPAAVPDRRPRSQGNGGARVGDDRSGKAG